MIVSCTYRENILQLLQIACTVQLTRYISCSDVAVARGGGGVLPYMGYIGMCGPKGYGFSAVLVINRVSILVGFGHFGHK